MGLGSVYGQLGSDAEAADADTDWRGDEEPRRENMFRFGNGSARFDRGALCVPLDQGRGEGLTLGLWRGPLAGTEMRMAAVVCERPRDHGSLARRANERG